MLTDTVLLGDEAYEFSWVDLMACFDENVQDSPSKINVGEIFKVMAPDTAVKVI